MGWAGLGWAKPGRAGPSPGGVQARPRRAEPGWGPGQAAPAAPRVGQARAGQASPGRGAPGRHKPSRARGKRAGTRVSQSTTEREAHPIPPVPAAVPRAGPTLQTSAGMQKSPASARRRLGGDLRAEAGVRGRYGGRLAAEGSTRLQPDWFSVTARGEARGHRRTDTPYNAPPPPVFPDVTRLMPAPSGWLGRRCAGTARPSAACRTSPRSTTWRPARGRRTGSRPSGSGRVPSSVPGPGPRSGP